MIILGPDYKYNQGRALWFFLNAENPDIKRVKINIDNSLSSNTHQIENNLESNKPYSLSVNNNDEWPLDERFTFEKFIVGPSNELAFASAKRLSLSEKFEFNPLMVKMISNLFWAIHSKIFYSITILCL